MEFRLPALPKIPFTASQWSALRVEQVRYDKGFVTLTASWFARAMGVEDQIFEAIQKKSGIMKLTVENLPEFQRAATAFQIAGGGRRRNPALVFFTNHALLPHYGNIVPAGVREKEPTTVVVDHMRFVMESAQQAAMVAVSQKLGRAPVGLADWRVPS